MAQLSTDDVRKIVRAEILEELQALGLDVNNVRESQADQLYIRTSRNTALTIRKRIINVIVGLIALTSLGAVADKYFN